MRRLGALVGAALLLAACGGGVGVMGFNGSVGDTDWSLEGISPDGRHLLVSTFFGGVASDCARFEGWEVVESDEAVDVRARLWRRSTPDGCTDDGAVERLQVDLDQPLGNRQLTGCGHEDCRVVADEPWEPIVGRLAAGDGWVAVEGRSGIAAVTADGEVVFEVVAEVAGAASGRIIVADDVAILRNDADGDVVALDHSTGDELWRSSGWMSAATNDAVYVCRGSDADGLAAVDATNGADLWATDLGCHTVVAHGDRLTIVTDDAEVDGGSRLITVDAATGQAQSDAPFFDGIDDRVIGFDGAIGVGGMTVVGGPQADLVVLAADGTELERYREPAGAPIGHAAGVVIVRGDDQVTGFDPERGTTLWTLDLDGSVTISVADDALWSLDRTVGAVSRLEPRSAAALWTTSVGRTNGVDVARGGRTAYILTTQGLVAVDHDTGEMRWSMHRPYEPNG